jgi:excisionase family DNA binding protein
VSDGPRRVPHVREVAVLGDFAAIGGYSAWLLARLLTGYPGGLEQLLARSAVPPNRRDDVLRAVAALTHVGVNWRLELHDSSSGSGTVVGRQGDPPAGSKRGSLLASDETPSAATRSAPPPLGTPEVAKVLGISTRMVRRLASSGALPGQRDAGGRWQFAAVDVAAERSRRVNRERGQRDVA